MENNIKLRSVRGTHDLYGKEIEKYNEIKNTVTKNAEARSFNEIKTPIIEFTELFLKPLGIQSDVVLKEMYTFEDRNNESLTLRPEYTTPMIRAAITNNLLSELPLKLYGLGSMFRRERPQKGRYREFNQINFETFGSDKFMVDLELIILANDILKSLLPNHKIKLHLNMLGTKQNLAEYKRNLSIYFNQNKHKLSSESLEKIDSNPIRILDSKHEDDIKIVNLAPSIREYISPNSKKYFDEIKQGLNNFNIDFYEDHKLVRGLDYYCSTVFEFKTDSLGSQDTLLGGGRYDGLIKSLGGPDIPGIGWAAGIERISMLMENQKYKKNIVHLAIIDEKYNNYVQEIIKFFRDNKISFYWNYKYNLKKSLIKANNSDASYVVIIGENEFKGNFYTMKKLDTGEQHQLKIEEIKKFLDDKS